MKKFSAFILFALFCACSGENTTEENQVENDSTAIEEDLKPLVEEFDNSDKCQNIEQDGVKQGYWCFWGDMMPEMGYPEDGKIKEGIFVDDIEEGQWTYYRKPGAHPDSIVTYTRGVQNGITTVYNDDGTVAEEKHYDMGSLLPQ